MKVTSHLLGFVLAARYVAGISDNSTPFNVKFIDSHIPQKLADELVDSSNKDENSDARRKSYEYFYIRNSPTLGSASANGSAVTDTYICEFQPESFIEEKQRESLASALESESQSDIRDHALEIIHSTFPFRSCLWAYDLRGLYWTYALCSGDKIIQYHEGASLEDRGKTFLPSNPRAVFVLGRFSKASMTEMSFNNQASEAQFQEHLDTTQRSVTLIDESSAPFTHHSSQKAISQIVTDGSLCDATLQPRTIEVVYLCDSHGGNKAYIIDVLEIKVCHYKMFVHVPNLCAYQPFEHNKNAQDSVVDVPCQKVDFHTEAETDSAVPESKSFDDYLSNTQLRAHPLFPVRADNRIDVSDHYILALGRGFYFAKSKTELNSSSEYYNKRNVVLFAGSHTDLLDLNKQFAKTMWKGVDSILLAPGPADAEPLMLSWSHSFIMWYEIYDFKGEFLGLTRLAHDSATKRQALESQLLDPVALLDVEGDAPKMVKFERPSFQAPYDAWNFEEFSKEGSLLPQKSYPNAGHPTAEFIAEQSNEHADLRTILAYNRGVGEDSRVDMELMDQFSGKVLSGRYENDDTYVFEIEAEDGQVHEYELPAMSPDQETTGFVIEVAKEKAMGSENSNSKSSEEEEISDNEGWQKTDEIAEEMEETVVSDHDVLEKVEYVVEDKNEIEEEDSQKAEDPSAKENFPSDDYLNSLEEASETDAISDHQKLETIERVNKETEDLEKIEHVSEDENVRFDEEQQVSEDVKKDENGISDEELKKPQHIHVSEEKNEAAYEDDSGKTEHVVDTNDNSGEEGLTKNEHSIEEDNHEISNADDSERKEDVEEKNEIADHLSEDNDNHMSVNDYAKNSENLSQEVVSSDHDDLEKDGRAENQEIEQNVLDSQHTADVQQADGILQQATEEEPEPEPAIHEVYVPAEESEDSQNLQEPVPETLPEGNGESPSNSEVDSSPDSHSIDEL